MLIYTPLLYNGGTSVGYLMKNCIFIYKTETLRDHLYVIRNTSRLKAHKN